jgi:hypothetical protein
MAKEHRFHLYENMVLPKVDPYPFMNYIVRITSDIINAWRCDTGRCIWHIEPDAKPSRWQPKPGEVGIIIPLCIVETKDSETERRYILKATPDSPVDADWRKVFDCELVEIVFTKSRADYVFELGHRFDITFVIRHPEELKALSDIGIHPLVSGAVKKPEWLGPEVPLDGRRVDKFKKGEERRLFHMFYPHLKPGELPPEAPASALNFDG